MAHDFFTVISGGGMLFRICHRCGRTDFMERVDITDDKNQPTGKDGFDWVPVYQRDTAGKAEVTIRECVGGSEPASTESTKDRLQQRLEEHRNKQGQQTNGSGNSRRV